MKDSVAKLTPLSLMLLALLGEGDMHPYEMIRLIRLRRDDRLVLLTNGTVYHTVSRLARAGYLEHVGVDRSGARPERTTYRLTRSGQDAVREWVRRELGRVDHPGEFRIALAEAHNLELGEVVTLLRRRRDALEVVLDEASNGLDTAMREGVPEQYLLEHHREVELRSTDLAWLDSLLGRFDRGEVEWGKTSEPSASYLAQREAARA